MPLDRRSLLAAAIAASAPKAGPRFVDRSMVTVSQQLSGPPTGVQTRAGWEATIKTLEALSLLAKPITVDEIAIFN